MKFVDGELTGLRPVLEGDLEALVHLLNESPLPFGDNVPWTLARLKKKYEDEKEPGLWDDEKRWYAVTELVDNSLCGVLRETHWRTGEFGVKLHLAHSNASRRELMTDAVLTFVRFKEGFSNANRINIDFLEIEEDKAASLADVGFIPQGRIPGVCFHLGQPCDYILYSWIPQWVLDRRAPDGGAAE
jgi:RimJ/RimL family protein N-acetyltransferase